MRYRGFKMSYTACSTFRSQVQYAVYDILSQAIINIDMQPASIGIIICIEI